MKIDSIELSWFRGASEKAVLPLARKSIVVYGENATGKTSFVDAIEYIMTKGKIKHLRSEYADRSGQRNCVRNTETPYDVESKATIKFGDDHSVIAIIPESGRIRYESTPDTLIKQIQGWKRQSHILRQDEVAEFINISKTKKYSTLSPLLGLQEFEEVFTNIKELVKAIKSESNYRFLISERSRIGDELTRIVGTLEEQQIIKKLQEKIGRYDVEFDADITTTSNKVLPVIQERIDELTPEIQRLVKLDNLHQTNILVLIIQYKEIVKESEKQINEYLEKKISILENSSEYLTWDELKDITNCPVCGREIPRDELIEHVNLELESLQELREISHKTRTKKRDILQTLFQYKDEIDDEGLSGWLEKSENQKLKLLLDAMQEFQLPDENTVWALENVIELETTITIINRILTTSLSEEPPSVKELTTDQRFFLTTPNIIEYNNLNEKIRKIDILVSVLEKTQNKIREKIVKITIRTLDEISAETRRFWQILHSDDPIEEIKVVKSEATDTGIDIKLKFYGTDQLSPGLTLSEGYRNSLGLCIFLSMVKQEPNDHPLILDDIVSSLDRDHRGFVADLLKNELDDRQVLLFTHDREWFDELLRRLDTRKWIFYSLNKWSSPSAGIQLSKTLFTFDQASEYLPNKPNAAGNAVRAIMDNELARISEVLEIELPFIRGPNSDKRTWYDFLEALISQGETRYRINEESKWISYMNAIECWGEARELLVTWANRASHGDSITDREAERLIERCQQSLEYFHCSECKKPVWFLERDSKYKRCDCGKIRWKI